MEYNIINLESFKARGHEQELVKFSHKVDTDQTFYGDDKGPYLTEEEQQIENARKKLRTRTSFPNQCLCKRGRKEAFNKTREEVVEVATNGEPIVESIESHIVIHGTSGQLKEEDDPVNLCSLQEQDKLVDRFSYG